MASDRNELAIPGGDNKLVIPAHIAAAFGAPEDNNIIAGDRVNTLGVKGKTFWVTMDGETLPMIKTDNEGNEYPAPSLRVVILDYAVKTGRSYYESGFVDGESSAPVCWSDDSVTPSDQVDEEVKENITSHKCQGCPKSLKGSAVSDDGKTMAACKVHRVLAVVPSRRLDLKPLRLRIAQTSNFDGKSPDLKQKQLYAFQNYLDSLRARGIPNTRSIVTQLQFDPAKAFPKLLFKAVEFLNDEQIAQVKEMLETGAVEEILGETGTRSLNKPKAPALPTAKSSALPKPASVAVPDDDDEGEAAPAPAPKPKPKPAAAAAATAKPKPAAAAAKPRLVVPEATEEQDEVMAELEAAQSAAQSAATTAKLKASTAMAELEAEAPAEDDEEAAAMAAVEAIRARKAAAAKAAAPAPKAAAAKPAAKATSIDVGEDDEGQEVIPPAPKKAAAAKPKAAAQTIEAVPLAVPAEVANLIGDWGADD